MSVSILLTVSQTEEKGKRAINAFTRCCALTLCLKARSHSACGELQTSSQSVPSISPGRWLRSITRSQPRAGCASLCFMPLLPAVTSDCLLSPGNVCSGPLRLLFLWCQNEFTWPVWDGVCSTILINYADMTGEEGAKHRGISIQKRFLGMKKGRAGKQKKARRFWGSRWPFRGLIPRATRIISVPMQLTGVIPAQVRSPSRAVLRNRKETSLVFVG